jgi:hypothetical protein
MWTPQGLKRLKRFKRFKRPQKSRKAYLPYLSPARSVARRPAGTITVSGGAASAGPHPKRKKED